MRFAEGCSVCARALSIDAPNEVAGWKAAAAPIFKKGRTSKMNECDVTINIENTQLKYFKK